MEVAYLVLLVALIPTFIAFDRVRENTKAQDQVRFDDIVAQAKTAIDRRLVRAVDQMYNLRAFFVGSQSVEPGEWKAYLASMNVRHIDLGIRSLGYAEKVTAATKAKFLEQQRAVRGTNFAIIPAGERPVYYPIVYISHFDRQAETPHKSRIQIYYPASFFCDGRSGIFRFQILLWQTGIRAIHQPGFFCCGAFGRRSIQCF